MTPEIRYSAGTRYETPRVFQNIRQTMNFVCSTGRTGDSGETMDTW